MTFERPLLFALLPLLALWIGWLEWRLPGSTARRLARLTLRLLLLAALIGALAGPYRSRGEEAGPQIAIAIDHAARLPAHALVEAEALVARVEAAAQQLGIPVQRIGFTTRAAAEGERLPASRSSALATGLAGARLALGDAQSGGIFILTDGRGDLRGSRAAAAQLREDGFEVMAGPVPAQALPTVARARVTSLDVPEIVRGPFVVRAAAEVPKRDGSERLSLYVDGVAVGSRPLESEGAAQVSFETLTLEAGLHEIAVALETSDGEAITSLDHRRSVIEVGAPPRVTTLLRDPGASPWRNALQGQELNVSDATADTLAGVLSSMDALPDLIVADAPSLVALPPAAALMLVQQVRTGLGLVVEAGPDDAAWVSLGAGPLAELLPIRPLPTPAPPPPPPPPPQAEPEPEIDPPKPDEGPGLKAERRPEKALPISLLLVIDRSPSMEGAKFEMALEGARRAALALSPWDRIGVITFAKDASLDVPFRSARTARTRLPMWLSSIRTGGESTNIVRALQLAGRAFAKEKSPILHLLLLTDGRQYPPGPIFGPVVKPMRRRGITITAVGIGGGASMRDLRDIVQWAASGMVVPVANEADLPTILTEDTQRLARDRKEQAEKLDARLRPEDQEPEAREPEADEPEPPPLPPRENKSEKPPTPPAADEGAGDEEEPLPLKIVRQHEALAGIVASGLPRVATPRLSELQPGAALLLERQEGRPILAAIRSGLGRVMTWTLPPDEAGALAWDQLGALLGQVARSVMAPRGALGYLPTAEVTQGPDGAFLRVDWPAGTGSGRLEATWRGPGAQGVALGVFTPEDAAGRPLPGAAPGTLCRIELQIPGAPALPPLSYTVARVESEAPQAADHEALERVLETPLIPPEAFVQSLRSRTLQGRLPHWPWFLWAALALLPLDVWLHRRSRPA